MASHLRQWSENRGRKYTQFPPEVIRPVTIYPTFTDKSTGNQINIRCTLKGCFWNDDSIAVFQRTGIQTANSVTLFVPYAKESTGRQYVSPDEWNNLSFDELDKYWTVNPRQLPLMVQGDNPFDKFEWASPTAANRITVQEDNFIRANPNVRRAKDVNEELFGSQDMWHIQIRA